MQREQYELNPHITETEYKRLTGVIEQRVPGAKVRGYTGSNINDIREIWVTGDFEERQLLKLIDSEVSLPRCKSPVRHRIKVGLDHKLMMGNDIDYLIEKTYGNSWDRVAAIRVKQIYGKRPKEATVLQEDPKNCWGFYRVQSYSFSPGSKPKTLGWSFTSRGAEKFARGCALKQTRKLAKKKWIHPRDIIDNIDEDGRKLRE